jgi:hypothetical protein
MKLEHRPYNYNNDEHGSLLYFRTKGPLLVLGYHVNRGWQPLLEITLYPSKDGSLGKTWDLDTRFFSLHLRRGRGMSEILIGKRRNKVLY